MLVHSLYGLRASAPGGPGGAPGCPQFTEFAILETSLHVVKMSVRIGPWYPDPAGGPHQWSTLRRPDDRRWRSPKGPISIDGPPGELGLPEHPQRTMNYNDMPISVLSQEQIDLNLQEEDAILEEQQRAKKNMADNSGRRLRSSAQGDSPVRKTPRLEL